jgi:hypothetical protein
MLTLEQKLLALARKLNLSDADREELKLKDILNHGDLSKYLPVAISEIVREAAEPYLIANELFVNISQKEGVYITMPAEGAMDMVDEVPAGGEYGTETVTFGGGSVIRIDIRKFGLKLALTEEMIEQSQWDVIAYWLKAAGRAFARRKNATCFSLFQKQGLTLVDNVTPSQSVLGRALSGRDALGQFNFSFGSEDFFDIYAAMLQEGFAPSVIVMHPMTWAIWCKDPFLKVFAWQNGGGSLMAGYDLQGVKRDSFFNGLGMSSGGARPGETKPVDFKGSPILPAWAQVPFKIMVSPQVPYNPITKTTDIYFVDPGNAGALIQAENINHHQWNDPERDIQMIKLREKYAMNIMNEGRGVGVVKNVRCVPNRIADFGATNINLDSSALTYPENMDNTNALTIT